LVDESGIIKKRNIPKNEIEDYPDLHLQIVIAVIFDRDGKILIQKRSLNKSSEPGVIDHVCGALRSGEMPEQASIRESLEETRIAPSELKIVDIAVNSYNRYRFLLVGYGEGVPEAGNLDETEWAEFVSFNKLVKKHISGEWKFVNEFFEDTKKAIESK
jgi:8-oxo-dGTP pyrophosphatase MutT (NUDIX family)